MDFMGVKYTDLSKNRMNPIAGLRFLRPCLHNDLSSARKAAYVRWFSTSQSLLGYGDPPRKILNFNAVKQPLATGVEFRTQVQDRIAELQEADALQWPRIKSDKDSMTIEEYIQKYAALMGHGDIQEDLYVKVRGRVRSFRIAGKALVFLDIAQDGASVQIVLNRSKLEGFAGVNRKDFVEFYHLVRRGDFICESSLEEPFSPANKCSCLWESLFYQRGRIINQCC
jgi:lysyl-tRNA synthetase class 2